jgi:hypothetical protein
MEQALMDSIADGSPRRLARIAGGLYLINILGGAFAITVVPAMLVVEGDLVATAQNIQAHKLLYRSGLPPTWWSRPPRRDRHRGGRAPQPVRPPGAAGRRPYASALSPSQLQALAALPGDLASVDYTIHTVFFGLDILVFAYLVLSSKFLPRTIGVLLAIDGLAYLCYSFTDILALDAAAHLVPWTQLLALIGEGSLCLWLLVVGINLGRWNQPTSAATELQPT